MRGIGAALLALAACMLCACGPLRPGGTPFPQSAKPGASAGATMRDNPMKPMASPTPKPPPTAAASPTPEATAEPMLFEDRVAQGLLARWEGRQAIVVRADGPDESTGQLWLYATDGGRWAVVEGPWPVALGMGGMGKRAEGDNKSPCGAFLLGAAFGWAGAPKGVTYPYWVTDAGDRWVDDADSPYYNRWVRGSAEACGGGEDLSSIEQYRHAVVVRYNDGCVKGLGSAIFLHVWKGSGEPTHGCTGLSLDHMERLLQWLDYAARPVFLQGTQEEIVRLLGEPWGMLCLPEGWGFADDFIPDIQTDIRYSTDDNFTGRIVPGYGAAVAPMRLEAIGALALAAEDLRKLKIGIRLFDAYRPQKATDAMVAWAEDPLDTATKADYYPLVDKAAIPGTFIARRSLHRRGGTVDMTLLSWGSGKELDMGGPFDFFGERSAYDYADLTAGQAENRALLRETLGKRGFEPISREWWHFSFPLEGEGDFDILSREHRMD